MKMLIILFIISGTSALGVDHTGGFIQEWLKGISILSLVVCPFYPVLIATLDDKINF